MRFVPVLLVGVVGAALGLAADLPSGPPSVDSKLRKLEIRRIAYRPRFVGDGGIDYSQTQPWRQYCRDKPQNAHCRVTRFANWLQYAFGVDSRLILGPRWMADDDFYMIYFEYDAECPCPSDLRSLVREILVEKFKLSVRREERESETLVLRASPGQSLAAFSEQTACSMEIPPEIQGPPSGGNYPPGTDDYNDTWGGPTDTVTFYRGCTFAELVSRLKPHFRTPIEVVDETGFSSRHDFSLHADSGDGTLSSRRGYSPQRVAQELSEQLGVDARIESRPVEYLYLDAPKPPKRISYQAKDPASPAALEKP